MTRKVLDFMTTLILILAAICALVSFVGCNTTTNKKELNNHDEVVDYIYDRYYANTDFKTR